MAINFTDSPSNGATISANGRTYTYNSTTGVWDITSTTVANPPGITATASGALANGDMVIVNSDGSVSAVAQTGTSAGAGSATVFESDTTRYPRATFDSNSNKVVVAYAHSSNKYGYAVVGTVSGNSISFGTPVEFAAAETSEITIVFDSNSNKVVIGYKDHGNSNRGTAIVGTVSGTSISFGTEVVFNSGGNTSSLSATFDSNANKVVFAYRDVNSPGNAIVGTVSGTSISFGSETQFYNGIAIYNALCFDSTNNKVILAYRAHSNDQTRIRVCTVSGTSISFGSETTLNSNDTYGYMQLVHDSSNDKIVAIYQDGGNSNQGTAVVGTVSGTSISLGSEVVFETDNATYISAHFASNINKVVIGYADSGNSNYGTVVAGTVSGTSISFGTPFVYANTGSSQIFYQGGTYDSNEERSVFVYQDGGNSDRGTAVALLAAGSTSTNLTANNYIGVSDAAYANSATATIQLIGSVDDAQSGLTAGQSYYVQSDGTLSTTADSPSVLAGTAISATKLIVKG